MRRKKNKNKKKQKQKKGGERARDLSRTLGKVKSARNKITRVSAKYNELPCVWSE